jgi:MFS family permease
MINTPGSVWHTCSHRQHASHSMEEFPTLSAERFLSFQNNAYYLTDGLIRMFCGPVWQSSASVRFFVVQHKYFHISPLSPIALMIDYQTIVWLIIARGLAGIGGGGIVNSVWVITSEIVDVPSRPKWSQALSVTWCCSAIAGPLLGGLFSSEYFLLSNRYAF